MGEGVSAEKGRGKGEGHEFSVLRVSCILVHVVEGAVGKDEAGRAGGGLG